MVLPSSASTTTLPSVAPFSKKRFHVYSDEILTRLLIDLFMSKKEQQPHAENSTGIIE
jgi:hypothetical protein